ncbi:hypothetical protein O1M63_25240 [Streptomyces mirabilis]|nr:hypothetical protein [Streptomyces mirabilis]
MDACTLGDLLDVVGGPSVRLQTAPAGLAVPVTEALLYDAHAPLTRAPGRCCSRSGCGRPRQGRSRGRRRRRG